MDQEPEQDQGYVTLVNVREKSPKSQAGADDQQSGQGEVFFEESKDADRAVGLETSSPGNPEP